MANPSRSPKASSGENRAHKSNAETQTIPVVEETVQVDRRKVTTGKVRVTKQLRKRLETVDVPVLQEDIHIERVPINREVDGPVPVRHEGDTTVIPVLEEVLVVEKRLILKEEIHLTRQKRETHKTKQVTLRREEPVIEHVDLNAQHKSREGDK